MNPVTVVIPVGPEAHHQKYLDECLQSVRVQTHPADEILLVDDMANIPPENTGGGSCTIWQSPWRLGTASAINCGVSLAKNALVYLLCGDDWLEPECIEACVEEYERRNDPLGYYHVTVQWKCEDGYAPDGVPNPPIIVRPGGAALVTKQLWNHTGGFPYEGGSPDWAFIGILLGSGGAGNLYPVKQGVPLCNVRLHPEQDSASRSPWMGIIRATRDLMVQEWKPTNWGRYE